MDDAFANASGNQWLSRDERSAQSARHLRGMVVLDWAVAGKIKHPSETGFEREWLVVDLEGKPINPARDLNRIGERADFECLFVKGNLDTLAGREGFKII